MDADKVLATLNTLEGTPGRNDKEAILKKALDSLHFQAVIKAALDPFITYGIKVDRPTGRIGNCHFNIELAQEPGGVLARLASRQLVGNEAAEAIECLMLNLTPNSQDLLWRILARDLRCGVGASMINKVRPGTIRTFEVMTAHGWEAKRVKNWPVYVEPKFDGVRVICIAHPTGSVQFLSRNGKPFPAMDWAADLVRDFVKFAMPHPSLTEQSQGVVFDGEVVSGNFNKTVGDVRRKSVEARDAQYIVFDLLPYSFFVSGQEKHDTALVQRRINRDILLQDKANAYKEQGGIMPPIVTPECLLAYNQEEVFAAYQDYRSQGYEGAMVKLTTGKYSRKRTHDWMKMKAEETGDYYVTGAFEGTGKYVGMLGGLVVNVDGVRVNVGGGFSDVQRKDIWDAYTNKTYDVAGRMIEVEYHEKTPDGSLRHPRFLRFRDDKTEA